MILDAIMGYRDYKKHGGKGALGRFAGRQVGGFVGGLAAAGILHGVAKHNPTLALIGAGGALAGGLIAGHKIGGRIAGSKAQTGIAQGKMSAAKQKTRLSDQVRSQRISEGMKRSAKVRNRKRR